MGLFDQRSRRHVNYLLEILTLLGSQGTMLLTRVKTTGTLPSGFEFEEAWIDLHQCQYDYSVL